MITPADSAPQAPPQMPASTWDIQAPHEDGNPDPIYVGGDADAGGRDDVSATVAGAQAAAMARQTEHASDTHAQGTPLGDAVTLPGVSAAGKHSEGGAYFDPPRDYGD